MIKRFFPEIIVKSYKDIEVEYLLKNNIKGAILDIDNTLVPYDIEEADEDLIGWIEKLKQNGIKVCLVSNASKDRVIKFNEKLKLFAIHKAQKPSRKAFLKAAREMNLNENEIVVIGDQIFTDIFGANRAKMHAIMVEPIHPKEIFLIKIKRFAEKMVLKKYEIHKKKGETHGKK